MSRTYNHAPLRVREVLEGVVEHDHRRGECRVDAARELHARRPSAHRHSKHCRKWEELVVACRHSAREDESGWASDRLGRQWQVSARGHSVASVRSRESGELVADSRSLKLPEECSLLGVTVTPLSPFLVEHLYLFRRWRPEVPCSCDEWEELAPPPCSHHLPAEVFVRTASRKEKGHMDFLVTPHERSPREGSALRSLLAEANSFARAGGSLEDFEESEGVALRLSS